MIFDMDGVLVDSNPLHREVWASYTRRHGIEAGDELERLMYGRHNDEIVRGLFGPGLEEADVQRHGAAKEALFRESAAGSLEGALVPGVREFLERHAGSPMAVASNAEAANVDFVLDGAGLRRYFRVVMSGGEVRNPKPHPEVYLRTADLMEVAPVNCIVFEDSEPGVEAARAAGMRTLGVTTTHPELPGVELAIADFFDGALEEWLERQELM
jgi:HAD superfamily hydrolase (TIGR01509 family)